jgi:hypothetical protein
MAQTDTERLQDTAAGFIRTIAENKDANEVRASAYALASLAGSLVGLAGAGIDGANAEFLNWGAEGFGKSAAESFKEHSGS